MFYSRVTSKASKILCRIAIRDDIDDRPMSPASILSNDSFEPSSSQIERHRAIPISYSAPSYRASREPIHSTQAGLGRFTTYSPPRPTQPRRSINAELVQQWRTTTTVPPRPIEQSEMQRREDQQQGGDSPRKPRDVTAHLKYLVRGFLKQFRAEATASGIKRTCGSKECFVPSPKITFLIDEPENLVCQICQRTPLKMAVTAATPAPEMTVILPCGHISCCECMDLWLSDHDSCPFCRANLNYAGCPHKVQPRIVAQDTIHTFPVTLTKGGKLGEKCFECAEKARREISLERWALLADKFKAARREAETRGTEEAEELMRKAQKAFEQLPEDDYWVLTMMKHQQW